MTQPNNAKDIYGDYKNGKIDYSTVSQKIDEINNTNLVNSDISTIIFNTDNLRESRMSYKRGEEYEKSKDYLNAIIQFSNVIKDDSDYIKAQKYITSISPSCKKNVLRDIDDCLKKKDFQKAVDLANSAKSAFPNDEDIQSRLDNANNLLDSQRKSEEKKRIESLKNSQEVSVVNISTTSDNLLNDVYLIVKVKNNTNKMVKKYTVTWMGFDSNGYPVETGWLSPQKVKSGSAEENIAPGKTSPSDSGFQLTGGWDKTVQAKTFIACVESAEYYDGSTWDNEYYDYWLNEYQDKQYH